MQTPSTGSIENKHSSDVASRTYQTRDMGRCSSDGHREPCYCVFMSHHPEGKSCSDRRSRRIPQRPFCRGVELLPLSAKRRRLPGDCNTVEGSGGGRVRPHVPAPRDAARPRVGRARQKRNARHAADAHHQRTLNPRFFIQLTSEKWRASSLPATNSYSPTHYRHAHWILVC